MTRATKATLEARVAVLTLENQEHIDTLAKARKCYSALLVKYSAAIATKNGKPSGGFDAKGRRAAHSVPSVQRAKSARRIEMDAAKKKAATSGKSVVL